MWAGSILRPCPPTVGDWVQTWAIDVPDGGPYKPRPSSPMIEIRVRTGSMPTPDLVSPNAIIPALKVNGKKQALQEIAAKAATLTGQSERAILEILLQREKLGSTGVGNGVAIPHGKLPKLNKVLGVFARLERPGGCRCQRT